MAAIKILEQALKYVENGISVFAIPGPDKQKGFDGKKTINSWSEFQNRIPNIDEIYNWFGGNGGNGNDNNHYNNNIAVVTGSISKTFAIDIDGDESKKIYLQEVIPKLSEILQAKEKHTVRVKTGGDGGHVLFRYEPKDFLSVDEEKELLRTRKCVYFGDHDEIGIRGNGSYIVGIGSLHESGRLYELEHATVDIPEIISLSRQEIIELFNVLDNVGKSHKTEQLSSQLHHIDEDEPPTTAAKIRNELTIKLSTDGINKIVQSLKDCYSKGKRNDIVFALSGYFHRRYIDERSILAVVDSLITQAGQGDDERTSRLKVVRETYKKDRNSDKVSGHRYLLLTLSRMLGEDIVRARQILNSEVNSVISKATLDAGFSSGFSTINDNINDNLPLLHDNNNIITTADEDSKIPIISIPEAARKTQNNEYVKVQGIVATVLRLKKLYKSYEYKCLECPSKSKPKGIVLPDGRPPLYEKPREPRECITCGGERFVSVSTFLNAIVIEMRDPTTFSDIDPLHVVLFDQDTDNIHTRIGETATITGNIYMIEKPFPRHELISYLYAQSVKYESNQGEVILTKYDIEAIERFTLKNRSNILHIIASKMFAPGVIGEIESKKAILLGAASTGMDMTQKKINVALIGPPGTAKSTELREAVRLVPNSTFESGQSSTGKSLTAVVSKENEGTVLRTGAIPAAKGAIAAINEMGRMQPDDQGNLLDVMQEQFFSFNKAGIRAKVNCPTEIMASFNPIGGKWRTNEKGNDIIDLNDFPAIVPIKDRFDLIVAITNSRDEKEIREYGEKKMANFDRKIPDYNEYLKKHIKYCKRFNPKLSEIAKSMLTDYYVDIAKSNYGSRRTIETVTTIAKTIAKLKLKTTVDEQDAKDAMEFYNGIIKHADKMINIVSNPQDTAVEEFANVLRNVSFSPGVSIPMKIGEIAKIIGEKNEQVNRYIGNDYRIDHNRKLRGVRDHLLERYHNNIVQTNSNPVMFQWIESKESDNNIKEDNTK